MHVKIKMPTAPNAWLKEIARAYQDAVETIPFGKFVGREIKNDDLFHLAPHICLKFRGIKNTKKNLKKAADATLSSYVATKDKSGNNIEIAYISFAFCYVASRFGLGLLDEEEAVLIMDHIESTPMN